MRKKVLLILFCFMLMLVSFNPVNAMEIDGVKDEKDLKLSVSNMKFKFSVPIDAQQFAENNYCNLIMAGQEDYSFSISDGNQKKLKIESPFVIYDKNETEWDEVYYYPISYKKQIILVMSVINTTEGWTFSASQEFVEELNEMEYQKNNISVFCFENRNQIEKISSNNYLNKIVDDMEEMKAIDILEIKKEAELQNMREGYIPSYSFNITTGSDVGQILKLHNRKGQGNLDICWAASIATIVNYRQGTNLTAKKVCDDNGYKYVPQNINVKKKVLEKYNIRYSIENKALEWKVVKKNISNRQPVAMSTANKKNGHAVTLIGYRFRYGNKYIVLWNSGNEEAQTVLYKGEGTVYQYGNKTWTWTKSLARFIN